MSDRPRLIAVVTLQVHPAWLALTRAERSARVAALAPVLARYPDVRVRWCDADALGRGYTDFALCEFDDLLRYHSLWEELRDTPLFTTPYMELRDALLGIEDGYRHHESQRREA
ncbi:MAG: darcynin family protein [Nannocystaceae bacterium]|nr:hypothetical protein [Myxococcales bacterium]